MRIIPMAAPGRLRPVARWQLSRCGLVDGCFLQRVYATLRVSANLIQVAMTVNDGAARDGSPSWTASINPAIHLRSTAMSHAIDRLYLAR
jgi:hypothetical protein